MLEEEKKENPTTEEEQAAAIPAEESEAAPKPKISKKKLIIIIAGTLIILLTIMAIFFFKKSHKSSEESSEYKNNMDVLKGNDITQNQNFFINLEDFVVDLSSHDNRPSFLKLSLTLNLYKEADTAEVNNKLPIIRDNFQLYLRELRETDLNGSGGMYKLKEELLIRLNKILYPIQVKDILFREILIR